MDQRRQIFNHPLFANLTGSAQAELLALVETRTFVPNTYIVRVDEVIDGVYFILTGRAEVVKDISTDAQLILQPLALLKAGDTIGLSEAGLYSHTQVRSASVIARSDMELVYLTIEKFNQFLSSHPQFNQELHVAIDLLAKINFLQRVGPFTALTLAEIRNLAFEVDIIKVKAGEILFQANSPADACYLIMNGKIAIEPADNGEHPTAGSERIILSAPEIFGETALLFKTVRHKTARVDSDASLMRLSRSVFDRLIGTHDENKIALALMALQYARARPQALPDVEVFHLPQADGEMHTTLRRLATGSYYQLTPEGWFIWQRLNGQQTLQEITLEFNAQYQVFDPQLISDFILDLYESKLVNLDLPTSALTQTNIKLSRTLRIVLKIRAVMEYRVAFGNVDQWLAHTYQRYIWVFYTPLIQLLSPIICIAGLLGFLWTTNEYITQLANYAYKWPLFLAVGFCGTLIMVPAHELAHAYTTKYYQRVVHCFGLGWLWLGPFAFCDTSDMWLSPRHQRIVVDLIGIYFHFILAGVAILITFIFPEASLLNLILWLFALDNYTMAIMNLSPMFELDGYYALADTLNRSNLQGSALQSASEFFTTPGNKLRKLLTYWRQHRAEAIFWLTIVGYILIIELGFTYFISHVVLKGLFGASNPWLGIGLVIIAVSLSLLSVRADLIKARKM